MKKRGLTPHDLYAIRCAGGADITADGRLMAYVVQRLDEEEDRALTDIYLYDFANRQTRRLTNSGKDRAPRFSPDGQRLAFVSSREGKSQLYILDMAGGEAWPLPTKEPVGGEPIWWPDGKQIAYTASVFSKPEDWQPYPGAPAYDKERLQEIAERDPKKQEQKDKDKKKNNEVKVITSFHYRRDGAGYIGNQVRQIFSVAVPEATPDVDLEPGGKQITCGDYSHGTPAVSPDGRYLVTSVRRTETADYDQKSDLWLWDLEKEEYTLLYDAPGPVGSPLWSPDGRMLAFTGHDRAHGVSTTTDLWLLDVAAWLQQWAAGKEPAALTMNDAINVTRPFDRPVGAHSGAELRYGGDSKFWRGERLYFLMSDHGAAGIYQTDYAGRVAPVLADEGLAISSIAGGGDVLVYTASQPNCLENIYVYGEQEAQAITHINDEFMNEIQLGDWEKITYKSTDGTDIDGWVVYPLDYQARQKYP